MILRFFRIDSLDKRLIAGLGAVIVLLIVVSVTGLSQFLQTKSAVTNIASNAFPVYQDAAKGSMAVAQFHAAAVSQTTTGDPKYVAQEKAASANFSAASDAFLKTNLDKDLKTEWEGVLTYEAMLESNADDIGTALKKKDKAALTAAATQEAQNYDATSKALAGVRQDQEKRIAMYSSQLVANTNRSTLVTLFTMIVGVVASVFIAFFTIRSVNEPIRAIARRLHELSEGHADLRARIDITSQDAVGDLAHGFNAFIANLEKIVGDTRSACGTLRIVSGKLVESYEGLLAALRQQRESVNSARISSEHISADAERVLKTGNDLEKAVERAAVATNQMASSIETVMRVVEHLSRDINETVSAFTQIDTSIAQVAEAAHGSAESVHVANAESERGADAVSNLITASRETASSLSSVAESISQLGEMSQQIGTIVETIDSISDQTNLLALNAAIEAARAGEHGRGFAVVADEVRKLAEMSAASSNEIRKLIAEVQRRTQHTVRDATSGAERSEQTLELADIASNAIRRTVEAIAVSNDLIEQISRASSEQSASSRSVASAAARMSALADEAAIALRDHSRAGIGILEAIDSMREVQRLVSVAVAEQQQAVAAATESIEQIHLHATTSGHMADNVSEATLEVDESTAALNLLVDGFRTTEGHETNGETEVGLLQIVSAPEMDALSTS